MREILSGGFALLFGLLGFALYLAIGTWSVSICTSEMFGHALEPWWVNTIVGIFLMAPATALAIILTILGWIGAPVFPSPRVTNQNAQQSSAVVQVASTTAKPDIWSDTDVLVLKTCAYGASDHKLTAAKFYSVCTRAAAVAHKHVETAPDLESRDEYRKNEAMMELYAGGAALEFGRRDEARVRVLRSKAIFTDLRDDGYNADIKSQSRRALACFFDHDQSACGSLFPGRQ